MSPADRLLTIAEAAERLGIGQSTAYDLLAAGTFPVPVVRVGRRWKVPPRPLERLLDGDVPTGQPPALELVEEVAS